MERQIAYDKLAREDRFVRMRARDVAQLKLDQGLSPFPDLASRESIKERVHGIMVGEMQAMEGAGRTVYDFDDAPWEFTMDMARQVWDESRHVEIYLRLLEHLEGYPGEFPETTILWRCACAEDAAARVAGVNRGLEGLACDVFNQLVHIARKIGDPILERSVDYVLADEITHVRMGSKWLAKLTEGDPERRRRAIEFQETIDERFNLGGTRQDGDHETVPISIATEARRLAGFTDDEIERLIKTTQRSQVY
ncbi:MAG: ferritin-like domain-containing protein [Candidatus Rokubacteria bacterium]|nr:ferritin-like domain-containing protein [Candidatus Rokubacteria bacterium]